MTHWRDWLAVVGIALTLLAYAPYVLSILQGRTRPHVFTWVIWASTTFLAALGAMAGGAGAGAWPIAVSGLLAMAVAVLAWLRRGDASITRLDWGFLTAASAAIPAWVLTSDPLWAVAILTIVDLLGFGPSFRKSYHLPFEDRLGLHAVLALRNAVAIAALEHVSLTTALFPGASGAASLAYMLMVLMRRRASGRASRISEG